MQKILRRLAPTVLAAAILFGACPCDTADAQDFATVSRLWGSRPATSGVRIRLDRREYDVFAYLNNDPYITLRNNVDSANVPTQGTRAQVSIRSVDGAFLSENVKAVKIALLVAGRPVWRGNLSPFIYYYPLWLPPGGYGEYAAYGVPDRRENERLVARITIQSGRGSIDVDVPVTMPRYVPMPFLPTPGLVLRM